MNAILDASAAATIVLEHEGHESFASAIDTCDQILAPEHFRNEAANTMWKYVVFNGRDENSAAKRINSMTVMVDKFLPTTDYLEEAFFEAVRCKHPVYDMLYLVMARRHNAALISCDKKLTLLAGKLGIAIYYDSEWMNK